MIQSCAGKHLVCSFWTKLDLIDHLFSLTGSCFCRTGQCDSNSCTALSLVWIQLLIGGNNWIILPMWNHCPAGLMALSVLSAVIDSFVWTSDVLNSRLQFFYFEVSKLGHWLRYMMKWGLVRGFVQLTVVLLIIANCLGNQMISVVIYCGTEIISMAIS